MFFEVYYCIVSVVFWLDTGFECKVKEECKKKKIDNNNVGMNLTKEVKDLYTENYKTLMKKIEDNPNK